MLNSYRKRDIVGDGKFLRKTAFQPQDIIALIYYDRGSRSSVSATFVSVITVILFSILTFKVRCKTTSYSKKGHCVHQNLSESETQPPSRYVVATGPPHVPDYLLVKKIKLLLNQENICINQ